MLRTGILASLCAKDVISSLELEMAGSVRWRMKGVRTVAEMDVDLLDMVCKFNKKRLHTTLGQP